MPAPKGHKKWGGRQKGTPNKSRSELVAICEQYKCNPFEGMVILAVAEKDPHRKFDKLERIANFVYAKPKAIELSGEVQTTGPSIDQSTAEELIEIIKGK